MQIKKQMLLLILLIFTFSCSKSIYKIEFTKEENNLPGKIIFIEEYFEETQNIFFIIKDYMNSYSRLVEYDLVNQKIEKLIFDIDPQNGYIREFDSNEDYIVFSVLSSKENVNVSKIYYYDIKAKKLEVLKDKVIGSSKGIYPIRLNVDSTRIGWLQHDFQNELTQIKIFDILTKEMISIDEAQFTKSGFKIPIFFLDMKDNKIIYDKNNDTKGLYIYIFDYNSMKVVTSIPVEKDVKLHFNGSYNPEKNFIALYSKTSNTDLLYKINLENHEATKLAGFYKNSVIYDDILESVENEIIYSVQLNVSGKVKDHYYTEIYDLSTMKMKRFETSFHSIKTKKYFGLLKFDEVENINKIHFELYEVKD